jgi:hypothetical protein
VARVRAAREPRAVGQRIRWGGELADDFKYFVDNAHMEAVDVVTAPLHIADSDSALRSPKFYLGLAAAGAVWGGSYALDQTVQSHLHDMSSSDADLLQTISYASICSSSALRYGFGLRDDDTRARQTILTAGRDRNRHPGRYWDQSAIRSPAPRPGCAQSHRLVSGQREHRGRLRTSARRTAGIGVAYDW